MGVFLRAHTKTREVYQRTADDFALVASNAVDIQQIVDLFSVAADMFGLTMKISKTELLYQPPPTPTELPETITVYHEPFKTTKSFTYLGSTVTKTNSVDLEVERRIQSATEGLWCATQRLWSCHGISCSSPLPALLHGVLHSLSQTRQGSDKTPASPSTFHPQHQMARPYPRCCGTAPCTHSQC